MHDALDAQGPKEMKQAPPMNHDLFDKGRQQSAQIAARVGTQNTDKDLVGLARELVTAKLDVKATAGTTDEKAAMKFHAGMSQVNGASAVRPGDPGWTYSPYNWEAPGYVTCLSNGLCDDPHGTRVLFHVNGGGNIAEAKRGEGESGAPFSNPVPSNSSMRRVACMT